LRNLVLSLLSLFIFSLNVNAQSLVDDKTDEFTKKRIKRTSWEILYRHSGLKNPTNIFYNISNVDSVYALNLKIMLGSVFSIDENDELMIKLANDSIITLHNYRFTISNAGGGSIGYWGSAMQGLSVLYEIDKNEYNILKSIEIYKIRIMLNESQIEMEISENNSKTFMKALSLVK
jgi:hypothetical protein